MKPFEHNVSSPRGAPMGRRSDPLKGVVGKLRLQRVPFVDGDYDPGGAYWGGGPGTWPLFCAWGETETEQVEHYIRARDRDEAKAKLHALFPAEGLRYFR